MQIKTLIRYHFTLPRMAKIKKTHGSSSWQSVEQWELSYTAFWNVKLYNNLGKEFDSFVKCKHTYTIDLAVLLPSIYQKEMTANVHTKPGMWMFTAALFVIANNWKLETTQMSMDR